MLNAADHLEVLFTSLLSQEFDEPWEIIAVDNGSDDGTANLARALLGASPPANLTRTEVVVVPSPRGYATPRNAGVRAATAPLLAFCDADGAVDAGWLEAIARSLGQHPLVASRKFRTDNVAMRSTDGLWSEQRELFELLGIPYATTAGLGCTRELFDALGGFDPHFDRGGEDCDFSLRARFRLGVEPVMEQRAVYWTKVPSRPMRSLFKGYRDGRSQVRLYERHLGQHSEPPSGPAATVRGLYRALRRLLRWHRRTTQQRVGIAWDAGCLIGRAEWSVRLRVRSF
ncbi:unannotated protein [freshwater metagenome]|uniref:Unannotated protein n=1 Tax=freshwater metagenome TaxID=449393 RepID=A0A6J6SG13_9ZZZZ